MLEKFVILWPFLSYLECFDLFDAHSEDEDIFESHLFGHLDVRAVHRADGQSAVDLKFCKNVFLTLNRNVFPHHEFHVSSSGGLGSRRRDLLGQIRGRDDLLGVGH